MDFVKVSERVYLNRENIVGHRVAPTSKDSKWKLMIMTSEGTFDSELVDTQEDAEKLVKSLFQSKAVSNSKEEMTSTPKKVATKTVKKVGK